MLQSIKNVRLYRPQHKVHHGIRYIDSVVHSMYLIAWYYCTPSTVHRVGEVVILLFELLVSVPLSIGVVVRVVL